jgi:bifunctional non-homologous end joining protein LigD
MSLRTYVQKRDFKRTAEPRGKRASKARGPHGFVIQKHDASRLHYDFRLELGGTLKSWAVPKGIPFKKGEKHLAVQVEDHPVEYAAFEGIIPKGQYGGGTVMVWDTGTYECLGGSTQKDLDAGKLHFALHGKKLEGEWTLIRLKHAEDNTWLLLKSGEDLRPIGKKKDDESAVSGRTMARIAREKDAEWSSHKKTTPEKSKDKAKPKRKVALKWVAPMKATLVAEPPAHGDWLYELKFDGYRAIAIKNGDEVQLLSRNEKDFSERFSEIAEAVAGLPVERAILDGEIVALDDEGRSSFQLLQAIELGEDRPPLAFYLFDLLNHDGDDLHTRPLEERRERLATILESAEEPIRYSAEIRGDPRKLLAKVRERGLEGIIGKERNSRYEPGRRSRSWIKLKCVSEQEVVIGGYTPPEGARKHFGALLVGYFRGGKLQFAGKVGTGIDAALL